MTGHKELPYRANAKTQASKKRAGDAAVEVSGHKKHLRVVEPHHVPPRKHEPPRYGSRKPAATAEDRTSLESRGLVHNGRSSTATAPYPSANFSRAHADEPGFKCFWAFDIARCEVLLLPRGQPLIEANCKALGWVGSRLYPGHGGTSSALEPGGRPPEGSPFGAFAAQHNTTFSAFNPAAIDDRNLFVRVGSVPTTAKGVDLSHAREHNHFLWLQQRQPQQQQPSSSLAPRLELAVVRAVRGEDARGK